MMMAGPSRGRRRRGRRGQRSRQEDQNQEQQGAVPRQDQDAARSDARSDEPDRPVRDARSQRDGDSGQPGERPGGGRKRTRGKRRPNRRPAIGPMPTEVLRKEVRGVRPTGTIILRNLDDFETPDGMTFGCPMLARTRLGMPFAEGRRVPRCSMGWALHNEEEALLCMRTPDLLDCWKAHPENEAALRASSEEENAAD